MNATVAPKLVGPVIRGVDDDIIDAVITAEDRGGYVRVQAASQFRLTQTSMATALGRPFRLSEIEPSLVSFAGRLESRDEAWVWTIHS
jgi:toluene monooxygenase system protein D